MRRFVVPDEDRPASNERDEKEDEAEEERTKGRKNGAPLPRSGGEEDEE